MTLGRKLTIAAVAVVLLSAAALGAFWWWWIRGDAPPPASISETEVVEQAGPLDGRWEVIPAVGEERSFAGYRVDEELLSSIDNTVAGRTEDVTGSMTIAEDVESTEITVDMQTLQTDQPRRDDSLRTRAIETDRFPESTFALTEPIGLGELPEPGETVHHTATGELTLHGITEAVEISLESRFDGETIQVVGSLELTFADWDIGDLDIPGVATAEDHGQLEFRLFFARAEGAESPS